MGRTHGPGYYLFPVSSLRNGGWARDPGQSVTQFNKYVMDNGTGSYSSISPGLFNNLLASAVTLNHRLGDNLARV